ncbi:MAG: type II secretion system protein GspC [Desulfobacterales bacterium]|nr:type II secretion system protein GspC [Desulfobacterales bacterium]
MIRKSFQIANLALAAAAIFFGVKLFYQFVRMEITQSTPAGVTAAEPKTSAPAQENHPRFDTYQAIVDRDLFDTTKKTAAKSAEPSFDLEKLEQTRLNLKLWGTVATDNRKAGIARAVIEEPELHRQGLYRVGDAIQEATILEIFRSGVVLDVNGKTEKLTLAEEKDGNGAIARSSRPAPSETAARLRGGPSRKISLKRSEVDSALKNLNQLMSEVKIRPYFQDGQASGFILSNIARDSVVRDMGLKTGDIVTGINGREIKTADDAMAFYEKLRSGETLSIELKRRGRPEIIEYTVE